MADGALVGMEEWLVGFEGGNTCAGGGGMFFCCDIRWISGSVY